MDCVCRLCGTDEMYLLSLRGWWIAFTDGLCLPSLSLRGWWTIFTVPESLRGWWTVVFTTTNMNRSLMNCVYRSWGVDGMCLPSLRGWWTVCTVPGGSMECACRPWGVDGLCLPFLGGWWNVIAVPEGLMDCIYRRCGTWGWYTVFTFPVERAGRLCLPFTVPVKPIKCHEEKSLEFRKISFPKIVSFITRFSSVYDPSALITPTNQSAHLQSRGIPRGEKSSVAVSTGEIKIKNSSHGQLAHGVKRKPSHTGVHGMYLYTLCSRCWWLRCFPGCFHFSTAMLTLIAHSILGLRQWLVFWFGAQIACSTAVFGLLFKLNSSVWFALLPFPV